MDTYLQDYLEELKRLEKSPNTIDAYRRDLIHLLSFLKDEGLDYEDFNEIEVSNFIGYLLDFNMSRATISRHLVSIRNFYKYLRKKNKVREAPILYFELPEIKRNLPEPLSIEEVEMLIDVPNTEKLKGKRDKAILELLYATGLKASEVLDLTLRDVDLSRGYISVKGKKNKERLIPMGSFAVSSIREYLSSRKDPVIGSSVLFPSQRGDKMTRQGLWKILKEYAKECGLDSSININTLRHSYAVHMLAGGADLTTLSLLLGHNDIKATAVYLKLVKNKKFKEVYEDAHPRA
ncbi:MAG TPA: tyrosine-type recombinase/integrase [Proteiniclasticum sp.]|nr:tyrosine-type recombinase/integrase [Proteiniclasticum sp.]